jgi:ketosteroid isomerase-like protein
MPSWLVDDPTTVYLVLGLLALVLGVVWWMNRGEDFGKKKLDWVRGLIARRLTLNQCCAMGLTLIGVLALAVLLLGFFVDTDQKRIQRAIREMSDGVKERNVDKIFSHISNQFSLAGRTKESFRPMVERHIEHGDITEVAAWGFEEAKFSEDKKEATIEFLIRPKGNMTQAWYRCLATFVRDPDGQWRLRTFSVFEPQIDPASRRSIYPP